MNQTKNTQSILMLSSIAMAALLTACGGGGSSGSSSTPTTPVVTTCSNGASDYPTCKFFPADLQLTVPTPPFAEGSEELKAFNALNEERSANGLGKLAYSEPLTKAAQAHSNYMSVNYWLDHSETVGKVGFTGESPFLRAKQAGYSATGSVSEGVGLANSLKGGVASLINSVYHRSTIFDQSWRDVGFGRSCYNDCVIDTLIFYTLNYGYTKAQKNDSNFVFTYPRNGQVGISPIFCGESPWPLSNYFPVDQACTPLKSPPDATTLYDAKVGYPVSIAIAEGKKLTVSKFEIFEGGATGNSAAIGSWIVTSDSDPNKHLQSHEAYLIPKQSLKLNTMYTVVFSGDADGVVVNKTWTFTSDTQQVRFN